MRRPERRGIVFVHPSDELYGADRVLLQILQSVPAELHDDTEVWLPTDLEHPQTPLCVEIERMGITVHHRQLPILRRAYQRPGELVGLERRAHALYRELRRRRPQLVYCTTSAAMGGAPVARLARVPRVVGHLQELWSKRDSTLIGPLARATHQLVTVSSPVRENLVPSLRRRAVVVPNATPDPETVTPLEGREGPLTFVIASRWVGGKGHDTLLAAWDKASSPGRLVILGGEPPTGDAVDVVRLVESSNRPETVEIAGEVADPHPFLDRADVVLVPSEKPEGFGLVAIEGFARSRPALVSTAGGLVDIVTDGVDGWAFEPGDVEALASLFARLERSDVAAAGTRARITYEQRYSPAVYRDRWRAAVKIPEDA
jgi:glycosyltransferase involved in cell wall biosynthesis